jgi:heat shock protein HtpX
MLLEDPDGTKGGSLWATHPPIEDRIATLVRVAGGRDPGPIVEPPPAMVEAAPVEKPAAPRSPWGTALPLPIPGLPGAALPGMGKAAPPVAAPAPTSFSDEIAALRAKRPPEA